MLKYSSSGNALAVLAIKLLHPQGVRVMLQYNIRVPVGTVSWLLGKLVAFSASHEIYA